MKRYKLSNTGKHIIGGALISYIAIPVSFYPQLAAFVAIGVLFCLVAWENAQYQRAKKKYVDMIIGMTFPPDKEFAPKEARDAHKRLYAKEFNKQYNWIDAIVDIVAGYVPFSIFYWLILAVAK